MAAEQTLQQPAAVAEHPNHHLDPLRHHTHRRKQPSRAERVAMGVAKATGTVQFLAIGLLLIAAWFAINGIVPFLEKMVHAIGHGGEFDPAPWILLNLIFSFEAFFTGSLVIIAARGSALREEEREVAEASHREELAQMQLELLRKNTQVTEEVHALTQQVEKLTREVHEATCRPPTPTTTRSLPGRGAPGAAGAGGAPQPGRPTGADPPGAHG